MKSLDLHNPGFPGPDRKSACQSAILTLKSPHRTPPGCPTIDFLDSIHIQRHSRFLHIKPLTSVRGCLFSTPNVQDLTCGKAVSIRLYSILSNVEPGVCRKAIWIWLNPILPHVERRRRNKQVRRLPVRSLIHCRWNHSGVHDVYRHAHSFCPRHPITSTDRTGSTDRPLCVH